MPHDRRTRVARRRRHREAYPLALELGITPREAEIELDRREAALRHRARTEALSARMNAPLPRPLVDPDPPPPLYWQRD